MKRLACLLAASFLLLFLLGRNGKKVAVLCVEDGCELAARGYDIESAWDEENQPIWAIFYRCDEGHEFIAEYEREVPTEAAA